MITFTPELFHVQLKKVRKFSHYKSQAKAARAMSISPQLWSLWELGHRRPNVSQLASIANFFKVDIKYFFIPEASPGEYIQTD